MPLVSSQPSTSAPTTVAPTMESPSNSSCSLPSQHDSSTILVPDHPTVSISDNPLDMSPTLAQHSITPLFQESQPNVHHPHDCSVNDNSKTSVPPSTITNTHTIVTHIKGGETINTRRCFYDCQCWSGKSYFETITIVEYLK
ncbi:hypothetical protein V6N11_018125 [Hibiscus sabdariffa]|uniref:Uncharacterized protein n=1 Tax=Hibiscus sabdariffa TaxID=183260 RepID=A0ABR2T6G2_9ROSI